MASAALHPLSLPPAHRGRSCLGLTAAAAQGQFVLQQCADCTAVQYPPREACVRCLSANLSWVSQDAEGTLLSMTTLHHSNEAYFRERLPWRVGLVKLAAGPSAFVHVHASVAGAPCPVRVVARVDRSGQAVLIAGSPGEAWNMSEDKLMREITFDPAGRTVLVTDGQSETGRALIDALQAAGACVIWAGRRDAAEPLWFAAGETDTSAEKGTTTGLVRWVRMDVRDQASVSALADRVGPTLDMVLNNSEHHGPAADGGLASLSTMQEAVSVNVIGLLRLYQAFGPPFMHRAATCPDRAFPWVNLLSIHSVAHCPEDGGFSASKAAALALSQGQRRVMRASNVRVVHCFPGPIDEPGRPDSPWPKLSPRALAGAILHGLAQGIEDIYPGDVAQDLLARWRADPLALQREIGA
ncbi:MAG: SDR family NAD(P)-dependent oxidoreductase [Lautropia sp.]|nr:SDR family NAD(P)-dependent oxidoreductase [Lautropia sp.]